MRRSIFRLLVIALGFTQFGCVSPIEFQVPDPGMLLIVEGLISDQPGPYTVKLSRGISLAADTLVNQPESNAEVWLFDDLGNSERMLENESGTYSTSGAIRGVVGRQYHLTIKTSDGHDFESEPSLLRPVGIISDIRYEFSERTRLTNYGEVASNVFVITIDSDEGEQDNPLIRWRFKGTFKVNTYPHLNWTETPPYSPYKDPYPCSGYVVEEGPIGSGGILVQNGPCDCCECWADQLETKPQLSDAQIAVDGHFTNVQVGEVQINNNTFAEKFLVVVEQMSLNQVAFDFFKLMRQQKENATDLFQPSSGTLTGNIRAYNPNDQVVGLFYATAISAKHIYIPVKAVPYSLTPPTYFTVPCYSIYANSYNQKPALWEE